MTTTTTTAPTPLLEIRDLSKSFGSVQALTDVDFEVRTGEVMALVGDNGAGKSTLIKCVAGIHGYDHGEIFFDGEPVTIHGPKDSAKLGIEVVYQDLALCDNLDVVQNMYLGREARDRLFRLNESGDGEADARDAAVALRDDDPLRPSAGRLALGRPAPVGGGGEGRAVELAPRHPRRADRRARRGPDAPGARPRQAPRRQGLAVVLISHNLHDIFEVADRITVLRLGRDDRASTSARRRPSRKSSKRSPRVSRRRSRESPRPRAEVVS